MNNIEVRQQINQYLDGLSSERLELVANALQIIEQKMPFLIALTAQERRKLFKMGDKSLAFVTNSVNAAQSNREIFPASFDIDEFIRGYQLATTLNELLISIRQLTKQVDDTLLAVGSEAMLGSLTVYDYVKTAAKKTPGLKTVAELLSDRFKAISKGRTAKTSGS